MEAERNERLSNLRLQIRNYARAGIERIGAGEINGSHLLGVVNRATGGFDTVCRILLVQFFSEAGVEYEAAFKGRYKKPLQRLTLGEIIECLRALGNEHGLRLNHSRGPGRSDKLIDKSLDKKLAQITRLRADLVAHPGEQIIDRALDSSEAKRLLNVICEVLDDEVFNGVTG